MFNYVTGLIFNVCVESFWVVRAIADFLYS